MIITAISEASRVVVVIGAGDLGKRAHAGVGRSFDPERADAAHRQLPTVPMG